MRKFILILLLAVSFCRAADYYAQAYSAALRKQWSDVYQLLEEKKFTLNTEAYPLINFAASQGNLEAVKKLFEYNSGTHEVFDLASESYIKWGDTQPDIQFKAIIEFLLNEGIDPRNQINIFEQSLYDQVLNKHFYPETSESLKRQKELTDLFKEYTESQVKPAKKN